MTLANDMPTIVSHPLNLFLKGCFIIVYFHLNYQPLFNLTGTKKHPISGGFLNNSHRYKVSILLSKLNLLFWAIYCF